MKPPKSPCVLAIAWLFISTVTSAQETDRSLSISLFTGAINYQGDLNPNSFTFAHSNFAVGAGIHVPLNRWFTFRAAVQTGKIEAADQWNRDYLKPRNLSFTSTIKEISAGLELNVLDAATKGFTPYLYGGIALFHFNPWSKDNAGNKVYLKPLSTEGQGLSQYPDQKPYALTQMALAFGGGLKFNLSDAVSIRLDFSQRKTFTDYLDDVSSHYVDRDILLQERGAKAVEMAYRGGQTPLGMPQYPAHGEQRGTPSEMDWYYFFGISTGFKLSALGQVFRFSKPVASQKCPRNLGF